MKLAGAPISWGVCEVPGWGHQLHAERVLAEMRRAGLTATELGPTGFLPGDPGALSATLSAAGLSCVGGFVPVLLHDDGHDPGADLAPALRRLAAAGAELVVLAAVTGTDGYDLRPVLDDRQWATLLANLDRLDRLAVEHGLRAVLHPHVGTMVQSGIEVARVLAGSGIGLCLDTGHLLAGGADPLELVRAAPSRIAHVHLKDVDAVLAARLRSGELAYSEAVAQGMYVPLGRGDAGIAAIIGALQAAGYDGWYVLEQDTVLDAEPEGAGPLADVQAAVAFLRRWEAKVPA